MPHSTSDSHETSMLEPIAICGMACRLPGGVDSASSFWSMLLEKRDGQTPKVPASRFNIDAHFHKNLERPGSFNVLGGYFLDGKPSDFDATAFNMTPVEAMWLDPQQRRMLEVAYECLESAGLPMEEVAGSNTAVFVGSFTADYQQMSTKDPDFRGNYIATGCDPGIISNRIGNIFNLRGPSFTINTACSSSVYAIHNACHALRARDCDAAIAGGVNLILTVDQHMNTAKLGILSPTSFCHTFDASADGYGRAEGAGALYLKRLADAIRDGDAIRAVIRSSAVNTNGKVDGMGITHPSKEGQERVVRMAYQKANLDPNKTIYAELHGTGTPVGDPIEVQAVARAMNDTRSKDKPLILGAVKPNIGHSEAASGIFAVMKAALMTENGVIPGIARFKNLNPNILEAEWNVKVNANTVPWPTAAGPRRTGVSSFGYGGTNGHVIIESIDSLYPWYTHGQRKELTTDDRTTTSPQLICFSAHDKTALKRNIQALSKVASQYYIRDLAYTLNLRRSMLSERAFSITHDASIQDAFSDEALTFASALKGKPGIGFIFTGQGAQWAKMGRRAIQEFPIVRNTIARLDVYLSRLRPQPTFSLLDLLLHGKGEENLDRPDVAQPACSAIQIAIIDLLESWGVHPEVTVGHSSGEIAAAYAAGLTSAPEAIIAAYCRGQAVAKSSTEGLMMAVGMGAEEVSSVIRGRQGVWIACENSPSSVTLSGEIPAIQAVKRDLDAQGVFARELRTGRAYHSPKMDPVSVKYTALLHEAVSILRPEDYEWRQNRASMVSSVTGEPIDECSLPADSPYWSQNLRQRVLFGPAVARIGQRSSDDPWNPRIFVEIGPHAALGGPFKQIALSPKPVYIPTLLRGKDDVKALLTTAGNLWALNADIDLASVNATSMPSNTSSKLKTRAESLLVDLPPYQWNYETEHWAEPRASMEQRNLTYARHDLLGTRLSGLTSATAVWRNVLRHRDIPWLNDHSLGDVAVFPAAGHMSLAIEAVRQLNTIESIKSVTLRDVDISTALVVPDTDDGIEIQVQLEMIDSDRKDWYRWTVRSSTAEVWTTHCVGTIRAEFLRDSVVSKAPVNQTKLTQKTSSKRWYDAFHSVGFQYGPYFQQLGDVNSNKELHEAAAPVKVLGESFDGESPYVIHPSTVDACLQLIIISIHAGSHKTMPWGVVPLRFDEVTLWAPPASDVGTDGHALAWTDGFHGRKFVTHTQLTSASGEMILDVRGLTCISYEAALPPQLEEEGHPEPYAEATWKPDIFSLKAEDVTRCWPTATTAPEVAGLLSHLLDHKRPIGSVVFVGTHDAVVVEKILKGIPGKPTSTIGILKQEDDTPFAALVGSVEDLSKSNGPSEWPSILGKEHDLLVLSGDALTHFHADADFAALADLLANDGTVLTLSAPNFVQTSFAQGIRRDSNFSKALDVPTKSGFISMMSRNYDIASDIERRKSLTIFRSSDSNPTSLHQVLGSSDYQIMTKTLDQFEPGVDKLVIIDDRAVSVWTQLTERTYNAIKKILLSDASVLWMTGGVKDGTASHGSMAEGFLRVVRSEIPSARITLMDIDTHELDSSIRTAVFAALPKVSTRDSGEETELWLRGGVTHICRVRPDAEINAVYCGPLQHHTASIPIDSAFKIVRSGEETVFEPLDESQKDLDSEFIRIQVEAFTEQVEGSVPSMTVGTVMQSKSSENIAGKKVIALCGGVDRTVEDSQVFMPIRTGTSTENLLANLPALYSAVHLCVYTAHVKADDRLLILPGSVLLTAALVNLCSRLGWSFKIVADSADDVAMFASRYSVPQSTFVVACDPQALRGIVDQYRPTVVFASTFDESTQEAWRNIPAAGKLVLTQPGTFGTADLSPLARGASIIVGKATELFLQDSGEARRLLSDTLDIFHQQHNHNERAVLRTVHEKEPQLNGTHSVAPRPIVFTVDYRATDVKVLKPRPSVRLSATASYLLVGCLGGLGRSLTAFMRDRGARNFVFVSRSGADKPEAARIVSELRQSGASVEIHRVDASNERDLVRVTNSIDPRKPLKGVVHAAMVLRDGMFETMSHTDFVTAARPKVDAAMAIQAAVANCDLDFFVMTSSISAAIGNAGQANYSAANSFLDQIAWQRTLAGQRATSIALPMVLDVGVVAETEGLESTLARKGMYGIDEQEMLRAFEVAMLPRASDRQFRRFGDAHTILGLEVREMAKLMAAETGVEVQWFGDVRFVHLRRAIERRVALSSGASSGTGSGSFRSALQAALATGPEAALLLIMEHVMKRCASTLMVPIERFEAEGTSVASYGLDSMIGAELRTWLFREFGLDMPFQELLAPTLSFGGLAKRVLVTVTA